MDRDKFIKLLSLTASSNDGEALAAIRKANGMIREAQIEWADCVTLQPAAGWMRWFSLNFAYWRETARRIKAERLARDWQHVAALRQKDIENLRNNNAAPTDRPLSKAASVNTVQTDTVTGHTLIDQLLASASLDAPQRARVEAIATWFRRTKQLTLAEEADLEAFARQL